MNACRIRLRLHDAETSQFAMTNRNNETAEQLNAAWASTKIRLTFICQHLCCDIINFLLVYFWKFLLFLCSNVEQTLMILKVFWNYCSKFQMNGIFDWLDGTKCIQLFNNLAVLMCLEFESFKLVKWNRTVFVKCSRFVNHRIYLTCVNNNTSLNSHSLT